MKPKNFAVYALSLCLAAIPIVAEASEPRLLAQYNGDEQVSIDVYNQASPAVVTIQVGRGAGSGSIISSEGLILTNEHVIRNANRGVVKVIAAEGKEYQGNVIAVDSPNDLALVRLNTSDRLPTIPIASANSIKVGQTVYAIGSPFGLSGTFTQGTLSRIAPNGDLQTDAAINPGNSGGPLLNSRGELIGVNKAILSAGGRGNIGIGFATSATEAQQFVAQNRNRTAPQVAAAPSQAPRLGISVDAASLIIESVERNSVAASIGLRPGDQLVGVNRRRLRDVRQLVSYLNTRPDSMVLTVARNRRLANILVEF
ncbi:MAG: trypsin-like peptidase domain-containing protein [Spirulinaceae cyanobacterium]